MKMVLKIVVPTLSCILVLWPATASAGSKGLPGQKGRAESGWMSEVLCTRTKPRPLLVPAPRSRVQSAPGCTTAACVTTADGIRVCSCVSESNDEAWGQLTLEFRGRHVEFGKREELIPVWADLFAKEFLVFRGDLDEDGRRETIVVAPISVSNGMAVEGWLVLIANGKDPAAPAVELPVEDWGLTMFRARPNGRACRLLRAEWRNGADPKRGAGLYLVGQWYLYRDGKLVPDRDHPLVARRYLYSFERERDEILGPGFRDCTWPYCSPRRLWFRDPRTFVVKCPDPLCEESLR
jgi:hypothetical protein